MVFSIARVRWKTLWQESSWSTTPAPRSARLAGRPASTCFSISTAKRTSQPSAIFFLRTLARPISAGILEHSSYENPLLQ